MHFLNSPSLLWVIRRLEISFCTSPALKTRVKILLPNASRYHVIFSPRKRKILCDERELELIKFPTFRIMFY